MFFRKTERGQLTLCSLFRVGGVPEVLPSEVLQLAEPNVSSIVKKLDHVIGEIKNNRVMSRQEIHDIVAPFYTWQKV